MARIGRNDPCPCDSGKKYKRCHGAVTEAIPSLLLEKARADHLQRERQQGLGKPIISADFNGTRFVAVKNRLLHSKHWRTFHDFLADYIKVALGHEWGNAEIAKPLESRHPILIWYRKVCDQQACLI